MTERHVACQRHSASGTNSKEAARRRPRASAPGTWVLPQPARAATSGGGGLSANVQNHQPAPPPQSSQRFLSRAVPPAAQPTSPAPPPQATWMWGLSQEAGCTEREAGCMGEVAGVPQETGRPEFSSGWGRGVQEGGGPRGKGLTPQRRRRQESRASRTHAGSRRARVSSDETGAQKTPGPRPGRGGHGHTSAGQRARHGQTEHHPWARPATRSESPCGAH